MKKIGCLILILASNILLAQAMSNQEDILVPEISINVWDAENSEKGLK